MWCDASIGVRCDGCALPAWLRRGFHSFHLSAIQKVADCALPRLQAIFNVEPGVSFHSVQEVYTHKPRMAIQVRVL
jgi:hypothetical protein